MDLVVLRDTQLEVFSSALSLLRSEEETIKYFLIVSVWIIG